MDRQNIFEGKLVRLRSPEPSDAPIHFEMDASDTEVARNAYFIPFPLSDLQAQNNAKEWAEQSGKNDQYRFAIEAISSGELVGMINSQNCDPRNGTFSYGLALFTPYHRQGYGSEAIILLLRYFFMELRYQKVTVGVYGFNQPSIGMHEKLGFVREGHLRRTVFTAGTYYDEVIYGMLREEFQAKFSDYWHKNLI